MERVFFDTTVESTQNFIKAFLKEIKPNGICREGGFSFLNTDLPYTGQIVKGEDFDEREEGFTFDQFDYWEGAVSFLEYESCTGSIVRIYITSKLVRLYSQKGKCLPFSSRPKQQGQRTEKKLSPCSRRLRGNKNPPIATYGTRIGWK